MVTAYLCDGIDISASTFKYVSLFQQNFFHNEYFKEIECLRIRDAYSYLGQGAGLPLRAHLFCLCMFLHNGRFWFSKSFLEGQRLTYWPNSHTMLIWGSGDSLLEKVSEPNCLKHRKMPLHKIEEIYRVQHEGQFLSLLPPWKKAEREAVFPSP